MGILLGKFRKKKTTLEILETVEKEIKSIEDLRRDTEQTQKRIVGRFVLISVGAYLLTASIFYFYFFPANFYDQLFYIIPLIFAPVIIITVKRGLTWYYRRKISRKQDKLLTLRDEKKKLLDTVKETETYKVAKYILDKYAPENQTSRRSIGLYENNKTPGKIEPLMQSDTVLRQRALPPVPISSQVSLPFVTPHRPALQSNVQLSNQSIQSTINTIQTQAPLPREILPRDRSVLDKMVDYLMGDGPTNRYALICKHCCSHNGMAHKDEFEYVSFKCCYCFALNPARKKRPGGPRLELDLKMPPSQTQSDASESEINSPSESESEFEPNEQNSTKIEPEIQTEPVQPEPMEVEEVLHQTIVAEENDSNPVSVIEDVEHKEPSFPSANLKD